MTYRHLADVLYRQAARLGPCTALRYRRYGLYHDLTWSDYAEQARACAAALVEVGIQSGDRVGLLSENRVEWLIADMGLLTVGAVNVPPHAPLTAKQVHYQLADAGVVWLFVSTREQRDKIRVIQHELPALRGIVCFDGQPRQHEPEALATDRNTAPSLTLPARSAVTRESGNALAEFTWPGFLQRGRRALSAVSGEIERRLRELPADALATVMYTSGTTGNPKGVMLTHANLLSNALAMDEASPRPHDAILFNWLPFSHIYARTVDHYLNLVAGVVLALAVSADTVVENLAEIEPTHISSVPRLYEKLLAAVATLTPAERGKRPRRFFGPRIDWLGSGGAPLPLSVAHAFQDAGLLILQGYGLTETAPVISFNRKQHFKLESVGQAIPGVEIKIAGDGEVLTRGPHVMRGYWNNPQASADTIRDGWLCTGDLGTLDAEGFLTITGRKKELMVLSNGKKVVPNHLEGLMLADGLIDQAVIHGEGRNFLTALIVPHWDKVRTELPELAGEPVERLTGHERVQRLFQERLAAALKDEAPWEQIKKFVLLAQAFSVAAEELTVSLKLRRKVIFARHQQELDKLYQE